MCEYQGTILEVDPACSGACEDCQWSSTVTTSMQGTTCVFSWSVTRKYCKNQVDKTWQGTTEVPCGESATTRFYCDQARRCAAYEMAYTAAPCP